VTRRYLSPRLLGPGHVLDGFECRSVEQSEWLRHHARQANASGTARVHVVTEEATSTVVAYYAWAMSTITIPEAPVRMRRGAGRYPQPVALLTRLGVSINHEGHGLGTGLLRDVITRTADLGAEIGCRGLLVHAENIHARDFYQHLVAEFEQSPTDELHLVLLMKDIHKTLRAI